ncbi:MAG TPA: VPDSG-CTERM sorting domain-containing protein [Candidatus Aquilonibacter sp.]|nr:VPDSG-CTERM sorting domain-containing protein [Candidatus Aquilonibacter sp.]
MKKLILVGVTIGIASLAQATSITVSTPTTLSGNDAYTVGIDLSVPANQQINSLTISFDDIQLTSVPKGYLYIDLLNLNIPGIQAVSDGDKSGDYFLSYLNSGQGVALGTEVFNSKNETLSFSITFNADELAALNLYAADGIFDLGIDPDCSFKLPKSCCSISYTTCPKTPPHVPDTASTAGLLGVGFIGLLLFRRKLALS